MSVGGRVLGMLLACLTICGALVAVQPAAPAQALSGSEFNPGYIISDELFYDGAAMSSAQIQTFLDNKIGTCQTNRCLNVAVVPFASRAAYYSTDTGNLVCSDITGGNLRVSELIYRVQAACGISAKVILVTLQKEQGLVTSSAPGDWALRAAMGMGCPDTAACDDAFAGLATQIFAGTRQLKIYKAAEFGRQPGLQYVQYNPDISCGGTNLTVRNYATAALYNYTPYQPNAAALANLSGIGNDCSSYGNRNFWVYYTNWFGPTTEILCVGNPSRDISRYWDSVGGASSPLGSPVSPGVAAGPAGTTIGYYANGNIYCTPRLGPFGVVGDIVTKYASMGGPASAIGSPISTRAVFSAGGVSGYLQEFQNGTMMSSTTTGTYGVLHGAIRTAWGQRGGSGGTLGWPIKDQETVTGGVRQQFQRGLIMVPAGKAAIVLAGAIATYWTTGTTSTVLGSPTSSDTALVAGAVTGILQYFDRGMVLSSTATGTYSVLTGPIRTAWGGQGGSGGSLGWPTGEQVVIGDGYRQAFQRGTIFASTTGAGGTLSGDIATYWSAGTNSSKLGYPTGAAASWTAGGVSGTLQYFEKGMVLSSATTGTFAVLTGSIRDAYGARGGSGGSLGWPTGDQQTVAGDVRQQFQGGLLSLGTGLTGDIATYWGTGANATRLGMPSSAATAWTAGGNTGILQYFQRGMVLSSTTTGTFAVLTGAVRTAWGGAGGTGGALGWPTADQESVSGGARQQFQHGIIMVPTGGAGGILTGDIATYWSAGSNASKLGMPTSSPSAWTAGGLTGTLQYFEKAMVLSSATTGTRAVMTGAIRTAWGGAGGTAGSLGWPTADQEAISGGVRQAFQHGFVIVPTGGTGAVLSGDIATYWGTGDNASRLGSPTTSPSAWTAGGISGTLQTFQRGTVLSSTISGTFAVLDGPVRSAWSAQGGSGTIGWPTGDQTASAGIVSQPFSKGMLRVTSDGVVIALVGEYNVYWSTGSNSTLLGVPTAPVVAWSASGVTGTYQVFEKGMVMSSATTGTFGVLNGPIRTVWGGAGGSGGSLGWPTADQESVSEGIQQRFQHGIVIVPTTGSPYIIPG